jgi:hypothetical protein
METEPQTSQWLRYVNDILSQPVVLVVVMWLVTR